MNRLAQETSPYLLQHADNPVDWYPWGDEAFSKARADDKPVLLSVGYAACHWCHVMEHESFEDEETAALMNERFVSVKVDREERPDVDSLYMDAVVALTGQGGWPMTVFLTPDGEPFLGGTYYPPEPRHGLPSFQQVLTAVSDAYRERRGDVSRQASAIVDAVRQSAELRPSTDPLTESMLGEADARARAAVRPRVGRLGRRAEVPARLDARVPSAHAPARRRGGPADGHADPRRDGRRRHVRPRRRRLPPVLGRPRMARPALREDALRQRAAGRGVSPRLGRDRRRALPPRDRGDARLHAPRAPPARGRLRLGPGRGHGRRRGADLHVDGRRRRARGAAPALRGRAIGDPRRAERGRAGTAVRDPRATTEAAP